MIFDPKTASDADCELHIISKVVEAALSKGFTVSVNDGEAWTVKRSRDIAAIMAALGSTDGDELMIRDANRRIGSIYLVYGNQPWEVIADHTDTLKMRELLESAELVAQQIEEARS